uniref:B30.2/SPRY domain-containing protein n=1 Tax=Knipowitschia caucasica TaxID=637954 RepID=A0AAV2JNU8_KNICA
MAATKRLEESFQKTHERLEDRQKQVDLLQNKAAAVSSSADRALDKTDTVFKLISGLLEKTKAEAKQRIRSQQEVEEHRLKELQDKVQEEVKALKTKYDYLEKLSQSPSGSIPTFPFLSEAEEAPGVSTGEETPPRFLNVVRNAVAVFKNELEVASGMNARNGAEDQEEDAWTMCSACSFVRTYVQVVQEQMQAMTNDSWLNPQSAGTYREELLSYSRSVTLDPNTAHSRLSVSVDLNMVRFLMPQQQARHPDRFTHYTQVLTKEVLTGRCYVEIEVISKECFTVAVVNKDISRKGASDECSLGRNANSWAVDCSKDDYIFRHKQTSQFITARRSDTVGIYVDVEVGFLAFYSVGPEVSLIHSVYTRFTQPLLAGIWLKGTADYAKICSSRDTPETVYRSPLGKALYK